MKKMMLFVSMLLVLGLSLPVSAGTLSGVVRDGDGNPVTFATVKAGNVSGTETTKTDLAGAYSFEVLDGTYLVTALKPGIGFETELVTVAGDLLLDITLRSLTGSISGSVVDAEGIFVLDAFVRLTNVDTGVARSTKTDELGAYFFLDVPVGNYKIQAKKLDGSGNSDMRLFSVIEMGAIIVEPLVLNMN